MIFLYDSGVNRLLTTQSKYKSGSLETITHKCYNAFLYETTHPDQNKINNLLLINHYTNFSRDT